MISRVQHEKPKKVGMYQTGDMIGKGAIGTVYKGLNIETG